MIVSWKNIDNTVMKLEVTRREIHQEDFLIDLRFDSFKRAYWSIEEQNYDSVVLATKDADAIRHAIEVMEYTESDTISLYVDGHIVEAEVSLINEKSRMLLHLDLEVYGMELIEDETTMQLL